jgi:hypothetical protein
MLRSRKLNEPGPNPLPGAKCACGCEVYMSRPQVGMKDVACMAANGDEASILVSRIRVGSPVPKASWENQLVRSRRIPLQGISTEGANC